MDVPGSSPSPWTAIAARAAEWLAQQGLHASQAIVLVPFAQLLEPARKAWETLGTAAPRIETTQTLAASLGSVEPPGEGELSFDSGVDRLTAAQLLRTQSWATEGAGRHPQSFEHRVAVVTTTAYEFARAASSLAPSQREAWRAQGRALLSPMPGPGLMERLLARVAFEWAAASSDPPTDRLFGLAPGAWIVVRCGGADTLADSLLALASCPTLLLDTDPPIDKPFSDVAPQARVGMAVCDTLEEEAQAAAAQVLADVASRRSETPVALIAQDRVLVRRVRALLERAGVTMCDETGWRLSTTRSAARVMSLLRAAQPHASTDHVLEWLKSDALGITRPRALDAIEALWRRAGVRRRSAVSIESFEGDARTLWSAAVRRLDRLAAVQRQPLAEWLAALRDVLLADGNEDRFEDDVAGRQVLAALHLRTDSSAGAALMDEARANRFTLDGFTAWVDAALEAGTFMPPHNPAAQVVITPLEQAMLRPFSSIVFPGTDEKRFGAVLAPHPLLSDTLRRELGLPDAKRHRNNEALAFAQVLGTAPVRLLRRRRDGSEPLAASPLVERLAVALRRTGRNELRRLDPPFKLREVAPAPTTRPRPLAHDALPDTLSATALEALRACPYLFYATALLGLRESPELSAALEKRDYGTWLHAVLLRFHNERKAPGTMEDEVARLFAAARAERAVGDLDEAELLPFLASFERLAPRYVAWLHRRDERDWRFAAGESSREVRPDSLGGITLRGRIDRIDRQGAALHFIDYKTGSLSELKRKVQTPLEDTQLAFYAALAQHEGGVTLAASYLALDDPNAPIEVVHPNVAQSAAALMQGLAEDLQQLREGAALPALGEGFICGRCMARGLCRRDHWPDSEDVL